MTSTPTAEADRRGAVARAAATATEAARPAPDGRLRRGGRFVADVWRKGNRDRVLGLAAENAFMAILTLFPILLVVAAVLGQLGHIVGRANADLVQKQVLDFLGQLLTASAQPAVDTARHLFQTGGNTLTFASLLALASLSTAFAGIINTVTIAYDRHDTRGWWRRRWLGLLVGAGSILTAVVVLTLVVVGPLFGPAEEIVASVGLSETYSVLWSSLRWPVAFTSLILWATTMDHICPDRQARWREGLPGGVLTAVLWLGASAGFNAYLGLVVPRSPLLGALGGGVIVMTWFYLLCLGLLLGAEVNAVRIAHRAARGLTPQEHPTG